MHRSQPTPVLDAARAAREALSDAVWEQADGIEAAAAIVELERVQAALDAARLALVERLDDEALRAHGWADPKDFLSAVMGGHKGSGSGVIRLAGRLRTLPATLQALREGRLSAAKARVIANRIATLPRVEEVRSAAERLLLEKAVSLDATDLDRSFPEVVKRLDPDGRLLASELGLPRQERAAQSARFLAFTPDQIGGVRIRGYATVEDAETIKATLVPLSAPVVTEPGACGGASSPDRSMRVSCPDPACHHDGRDPREFGARLLDALVGACTRLHATDVVPTSHAVAARMVVTMSLDDLRAQIERDWTGLAIGDAGAALPGGLQLSAQTARRIACDTEIVPIVLGSQSQILDVGRAERFVTPAIWHALVTRDGGCAFPGCNRLPIATDAHHIVHWADGGVTALHNLILLCRCHHTLVHHSPWTVRIDDDTGRPVWIPPPARALPEGIVIHPPPVAA